MYFHGTTNFLTKTCTCTRGVYRGQTWEQRLAKRSEERQLVPTTDLLEDRAWAEEDDVFADIAGRRKRRRYRAEESEQGSECRDDMLGARKVGCITIALP